MAWFFLAVGVAPLLVAGFIWLLLRKLRRAGRPDRAGELVALSGAAFFAGSLIANLSLDDPPGWLPYAFLTPWVLVTYGFAAYRLRKHLPHLTGPRRSHQE